MAINPESEQSSNSNGGDLDQLAFELQKLRVEKIKKRLGRHPSKLNQSEIGALNGTRSQQGSITRKNET